MTENKEYICECPDCLKKRDKFIEECKEEIREKTQSLDKGAVDMAY